MPDAISDTSPLLYLHRIGVLGWLPRLFGSVWAPQAVCDELYAGRRIGLDTPNPSDYGWMQIVNPSITPSEWLALDLGPGELAAMALALGNPSRVILLDDALARRTAIAAGLTVWGTLRILLEAKNGGLTEKITPHIDQLRLAGMWFSDDIRRRIISMASES